MPSKLKIAKVIPLYKTKDPALFSNYRPISLLPFFSKILERLMHNRLYNFLTEHNILAMNQFGFRKNYSKFLALMDLVDNISKNIDEGNYSIGIFLDLSKAFDTIDHTILLDKLCRYGIIVCRLVYICINFCYTLGNHDYFLRNTYLSGKNVVAILSVWSGVIFSTKCTKT